MTDFTAITDLLQSHHDLTEDQMVEAIEQILNGNVAEPTIVDFLKAIYAKGETAEELAGAARAMRAAMHKVNCSTRPVFDTCGTGGDGSKTFNISTAAAIVLAATGCRVAKHGNRKITSSTGSADVLAELGVNLDASPELVQRCLAEANIGFCFAPNFHPAMRHVATARRQLSHPTIFNRLGPLTNPAMAEHQVIGVGDARLQPLMAATLQRLNTTRSLVVRGIDGVDEISLSAPTKVLEVSAKSILEHQWTPESFGLATAKRDTLFADDPASSAACIRQVLDGQVGPCRDVVVLNAAAALWLSQPTSDLVQCAQQVQAAIDSGQAQRVLAKLAALTNQS